MIDNHDVNVERDGKLYRCTVQCLVMNNDGQFLVGKAPERTNENYLFPVQGGVEKGESLLDTAKRELYEEMGVKITQLDFVSLIIPDCGSSIKMCTEVDLYKAAALINQPFFYRTKKKKGIFGQDVFPLFFSVNTYPLNVRFDVEASASNWEIKPTFKEAYWVDLSSLSTQAPPRKAEVMHRIVAAAERYKQHYYESRGWAIPARMDAKLIAAPTCVWKKPPTSQQLQKKQKNFFQGYKHGVNSYSNQVDLPPSYDSSFYYGPR